MCPLYKPALRCKCVADFLLHFCLGGPAYLIGRKSQVSACHKIDLTFGAFRRICCLRNRMGAHDYSPWRKFSMQNGCPLLIENDSSVYLDSIDDFDLTMDEYYGTMGS